jgi:hypothetical protein
MWIERFAHSAEGSRNGQRLYWTLVVGKQEFDILSPMTKLLSEVMRQITELPKERQDDAARVLMMMLEQDPEQYRLTDAQLREVDVAIADTDAGNFAGEKEIDAILNRSWA